jgi:hypothetical protein
VAFIISSLPVAEQAAHLRQYLDSRGLALSETAAQNVCRSISLDKAGESKLFGRKLVAALAAHGVVIKHSNALEALSRMCGQANWMRTLQASLPFEDEAPAPILYALQATRYGEVFLPLEGHRTMSETTDRLLKVLAQEWPTTVAVSQAILGVSAQMLVVELEHPTAPWLEFRLCRMQSSSNGGSLTDLPAAEVLIFCERATRALEYTYPGTLVLNSLRSSTLAPQYYFCPEVRRLETGDKRICWADMELLPVLDSLRPKPNATYANGVLRFDSEQGPVEVTPLWTSNTDQRHLPAEVNLAAFNGLLTRLERLRRITGGNVTHHLARVMTGQEGPAGADDHTPVDKGLIETTLQELNLTAKQLATLSGLHLNVVHRVLKYGYAHESVVRKLSQALGLVHPNALLPKEKDEGIGYRLEDGKTFLQALRKTHLWRRIVSDNLQGEEAEEVNRIAESLQEFVELAEFRIDPANVRPPEFAEEVSKPIDEAKLAGYIQDLLDELKEMDVAVLVTTGIRFAHGKGHLAGMNGMPLHEGTLYFERVDKLRAPSGQSAKSA